MAPSAAAVAAAVTGGFILVKIVSKMRYNQGRINLSDKAIFISGCDSGFGHSLALHCRHNLCIRVVAGCFGLTEAGAQNPGGQGAEALLKAGVDVVPLDVTDDDSVVRAVEATEGILKESGARLWCVVNNAATLSFGEATWQPRLLVGRQMAVNVEGALALTAALMPALRDTVEDLGSGTQPRVVNLLSFCTECPLPTLSVYTASKMALRALSIGMRMELAREGIKVVMLNPGDHPGATPLCAGQSANYDRMEEHLRGSCRDFGRFEKCFQGCRSKFTTLFPDPPLTKLDDPGFYRTFEDILTARKPRNEYVNAPIAVKLFYAALARMPDSWADRARVAMMRLPKV